MVVNETGKRIYQLRKSLNKTQEQFSKDLGITRALVSYYENGSRHPGVDAIVQMAKYFSVSTDYLLGVSDCKNPENQTISKELGLSEEAIFKISTLQINKKMHISSHLHQFPEVWEIDILSKLLEKISASGLLTLIAAYKLTNEWERFLIADDVSIHSKEATMYEITTKFRELVENIEL